jgi:hypothetical protein
MNCSIEVSSPGNASLTTDTRFSLISTFLMEDYLNCITWLLKDSCAELLDGRIVCAKALEHGVRASRVPVLVQVESGYERRFQDGG